MENKKATKRDSKMLCAGARLKKLREDAGLTQDELAELIDNLPENNRTGRSRNQISYIENGSRAISADYARLLSKVLNVKPEYLLLETHYKNDFDEKYSSEHHDKATEDFFNYMGYKIERPYLDRFYRITATVDSLKDEEYISSLVKSLDYSLPVYSRNLVDNKGRKKYICSDELRKIYEDVISYAKWKIEQEFNDITRYRNLDDTKGTFNKDNEPDTD